MSYRKFKGVKLSSEKVCPICQEEMHRCAHVGKRHIVKDVGDAGYVPLFADDEFNEVGEPNYIEISCYYE